MPGLTGRVCSLGVWEPDKPAVTPTYENPGGVAVIGLG